MNRFEAPNSCKEGKGWVPGDRDHLTWHPQVQEGRRRRPELCCQIFVGERLDRGFFRAALMLQLRQEIALLQRGATPQKFQQRIFQLIPGLFRFLFP